MESESVSALYDTIGEGYQSQRQPDARIASRIRALLGDARTVCNIGAGTGSYEPTDLDVTAVEPSRTMIDQRSSSVPVVQAAAESLPFVDRAFDASMAALTIHHWKDPQLGLREMRRVSRQQVIFTFDVDEIDSFWLVSDYFPEIIELDEKRAVPIEMIAETLDNASIEIVPIPWDCTDGFQAAYWRRPTHYLQREVRAAISTLAQLPSRIVDRGVSKLAADLESGEWHRRYDDLLTETEMDFGYRLVSAHNS